MRRHRRRSTGLAPGAHTFEARAIDRAGNVDGTAVRRSWTIAIPDADNDGFNATTDCNDANPAIFPGRVDVPGNGVDENCDGADAVTPPGRRRQRSAGAPEQVIVTVAFFASASKKSTKFTTLQVKNVPLGATVTVTCKGKGCPSGLKGKGFTKKNAFGTVTLAKFIKKPLQGRRHDHRRRLQAERDQRGQDRQGPRVEEAADHDPLPAARRFQARRLLNLDELRISLPARIRSVGAAEMSGRSGNMRKFVPASRRPVSRRAIPAALLGALLRSSSPSRLRRA